MKTNLKIMAFGSVSGLVWSLVAATLMELFDTPRQTPTAEIATVIGSGLLAGVSTSFAMRVPLRKFGKPAAVMFGALSLPLGAFLFGALLSFAQWGFLGRALAPLERGLLFAGLSVITIFGVALLPLAVLTTFILRRVVGSGHQRQGAV